MTTLSLLTFAVVFAAACASPGPSMTALAARVIGRGMAGTPCFCLGLLLGDLVWLASAAFGLAALAALFQPVFLAIKYLGAAYLMVLAWRLWRAAPAAPGAAPAAGRDRGLGAALGGLALALGNPKTMVFYLAVLPSVIPLPGLGWAGFAVLAAIVVAIYSAVMTGYVVLASRLRRALADSRAARLVNRAVGTIMAGAAVAIVAE